MEWLEKHNSCPICRYELETDNPEYEKGRLQRMAGRKPRYRIYELKRMKAKDLKELCKRLGIPVPVDVLEKEDMVQKVIGSGKIDIISSPEPCEFKLSDLRAMSIGKLKKTMNEAGVFFDPIDVVEKNDMLLIFLNSGRLNVIEDDEREEENERKDDYLMKNYVSSTLSQTNTTANVSISDSFSPLNDDEIEELGKNDECHERDSDSDIEEVFPSSSSSSAQQLEDIMECDDDSMTQQKAPISTPYRSYGATSAQTSLATRSVPELKSFAVRLGIGVGDCVEKSEILERIASAVSSNSRML